jgi:hypothetical protein
MRENHIVDFTLTAQIFYNFLSAIGVGLVMLLGALKLDGNRSSIILFV